MGSTWPPTTTESRVRRYDSFNSLVLPSSHQLAMCKEPTTSATMASSTDKLGQTWPLADYLGQTWLPNSNWVTIFYLGLPSSRYSVKNQAIREETLIIRYLYVNFEPATFDFLYAMILWLAATVQSLCANFYVILCLRCFEFFIETFLFLQFCSSRTVLLANRCK